MELRVKRRNDRLSGVNRFSLYQIARDKKRHGAIVTIPTKRKTAGRKARRSTTTAISNRLTAKGRYMSSIFSRNTQETTATGWTDARVETLKDRWGKGWSPGEIMRDLPGFTRNAILGKIDRMKLTRNGKPRQAPRVRPPKPAKPAKTIKAGTDQAAEPIVEPVAEIPDTVGVQLFDLTNETCRWPRGTPGCDDFSFCGSDGADFIAGKSYCRKHTAAARR